jgi:hypothetical protein
MSRASSVPETVLRLARRAGRGRQDLVHLVRLGEPPELGEGGESRFHGRLGQPPAVEAAGAEPHHLLLAVNDFEGQVGADLDDDHVDRIGPDVDGSQTHAFAAGKRSAGTSPRPSRIRVEGGRFRPVTYPPRGKTAHNRVWATRGGTARERRGGI